MNLKKPIKKSKYIFKKRKIKEVKGDVFYISQYVAANLLHTWAQIKIKNKKASDSRHFVASSLRSFHQDLQTQVCVWTLAMVIKAPIYETFD